MRSPAEASFLSSARTTATTRLAAAGADSPALDARLLLQAATGLDAATLAASPERALTTEEAARFEALLTRRIAREPMSQILGRAGFWTLELLVTADVLTPRPETETVLEAALGETSSQAEGRVIDLGVGPGTLLLAFLSERPGWSGVGVDISERALAVAQANARRLGLAGRAAFLRADWDAPISLGDQAQPASGQGFELLLSNPPYIASAEIDALAPEVRDHEPRLALDGGTDGLDAYRRIARSLPRLLGPRGVAALETGATQGADVAAIMTAQARGGSTRIVRDLEGRERAVVVRLGG